MKNENALTLTPVRETISSLPLAVAERGLGALLVYAGLLGAMCAAFGWQPAWAAMALGAAALLLAVWCAMGRGWRQWLPVGLALLAAAWCLLLPQARDSAAGLFNSVLAYVQALTGRIHLPLACEETAALWAAIPACIVLGALLGSLAVYAPVLGPVLALGCVVPAMVKGEGSGLWLAILCLGAALLCLGRRKSCRPASAVSLWTAALLLILGALTAGVVALTGLNTTLNPERANDSLRQTLHALRYESAHQAMPEGDFAAGVDFSDTPMLKVTLSRPEALYLRGFIGQRYTRQGWEDLSAGIFEKPVTVTRLGTAYRSTVEIMETAFSVIARHPVAGEGAARPVERHGEKPFLLSVKAPKERPAAAARAIRSWQGEGFVNIAVIVKTGKAAVQLQKALVNLGCDAKLVRQGDDNFQGGVQVMDASIVKGLEFDCVLIADAEAASYPDERFYAKLFYVLCTRPLHRLGFVSVGEKTALLQDADLREKE